MSASLTQSSLFVKNCNIEKANNAWDNNPPSWVVELAKAVNQFSLGKLSKDLGYSSATISMIINNKYKGDYTKIENIVRGFLMKETVECPVVGEIMKNICADHQAKSRTLISSSSMRAMLHRTCPNCNNNLDKKEGQHE